MLTSFSATAQHVLAPPQFSDDDLPTIEAVVERKRREAEARVAKTSAASKEEIAPAATAAASSKAQASQDTESGAVASAGLSGPEALEAEADQQGAFNPETGEINWDCPCLGGMADGPCGEDFKAAFSCFVYSKEEPKGMDCIDKFQYVALSKPWTFMNYKGQLTRFQTHARLLSATSGDLRG
jgi:intermembrane space import and assembly protein 40